MIPHSQGGTLTVSVNIIFNDCLLHFRPTFTYENFPSLSLVTPKAPFQDVSEWKIINCLKFLVDERECSRWIRTSIRMVTIHHAKVVCHSFYIIRIQLWKSIGYYDLFTYKIVSPIPKKTLSHPGWDNCKCYSEIIKNNAKVIKFHIQRCLELRSKVS